MESMVLDISLEFAVKVNRLGIGNGEFGDSDWQKSGSGEKDLEDILRNLEGETYLKSRTTHLVSNRKGFAVRSYL